MTLPAAISVVVPTLNEAGRIARCIAAIREDDPATEIIVADGGSTDDTVRAAGACAHASARVRVHHAPPGRSVQMNAGARAAAGDVLLFMHADSLLPADGLGAIRAALQDPRVVGGTFRLRFDEDSLPLRVYAWCTRFRFRLLHYGDQGIFVRRAVFDAMGGFREWPLMEDVDFLARLERMGRVALLPLAVTTSARRFRRHGVIRQQLLNATLVSLFLLGVSPVRLARWYENVHR